MKCLLVTTNPLPHLAGTEHPHGAGWNVGDVFARLGTEQLIRRVDPNAHCEIVNMDSAESITTPRAFDRAIFAGRPMFWRDCETHPLWSELINGWLCVDPRKVMALGVGDCFPLPTPSELLAEQVAKARARMWRVTLRRRGYQDFTPCPATWLLLDRPEVPTLKLCNFMPLGAHYPEMNPAAAAFSDEKAGERARTLIDDGWLFVAHSSQERALALRLGWTNSKIIFGSNVSTYLAAYAGAKAYIGNRLHGALVLASRESFPLGVGYDSRIFAVLSAMIPVTPPEVWDYRQALRTNEECAKRIQYIREQRELAVALVREFASEQ